MDYCNCDASFLPMAIEIKCFDCGFKNIIEEDELNEYGNYVCETCLGIENDDYGC